MTPATPPATPAAAEPPALDLSAFGGDIHAAAGAMRDVIAARRAVLDGAQAKYLRCECCGGARLHALLTTIDPATRRRTRVRACTYCDSTRPYGVCCPACGDPRLLAQTTRHRPDGSTVRTKVCQGCGHRCRTAERVEAAAA